MHKVLFAAVVLIAFWLKTSAWADDDLSSNVSPPPPASPSNNSYPAITAGQEYYYLQEPPVPTSVCEDNSVYQEGTNAPPCTFPTPAIVNHYPFWIRVGARQWWTKGRYVPPLATTSNTADEGIVGQPSTEILYGGENINVGSRGNVDIGFGWCRDPEQLVIWEFEILNVGDAVDDFEEISNGSPLLAVPYYDVLAETPASMVLADSEAAGAVGSRVREYLFIVGIDRRWNVLRREEGEDCNRLIHNVEQPRGLLGFQFRRADFVAGYRHYRMEDSISHYVFSRSTQPIGELPPGMRLENTDRFFGENEFHGGELGCVIEFGHKRWTLEMFAKMALGNNHQSMCVKGANELELPEGYVFTINNEALLQGSIEENYSRNRFSIIPRFGLDLSFQLSQRWSISVGYEFIYWPNVVRGSEQTDYRIITGNLLEGPNLGELQGPAYSFRTSSYWAQSLNLGLEFCF